MRHASQPPYLACACALALLASGCGAGDADAPDDVITSDAAAVGTSSEAGTQGGNNRSPEAGTGATGGDAGQANDAGRRTDAGRADAANENEGDAGASDAGRRDGGTRDAGNSDAGTHDGGTKTTVVNATIIVAAGQTFDGEGQRYIAGAGVGNGSQDEGQKPIFRLEAGASLKNVVLGAPAADGIHTYGDATLSNIVWEDIGEDAMTIKAPGTVVLDGGSATNGEDKIFQINAESVFRVSNFTASHAGKLIRQNGGTTFKIEVHIDRCDISFMDEAIFRTDSSTSTVSLTNTRYSEIGKSLFVGVAAANITQSGNTEY